MTEKQGSMFDPAHQAVKMERLEGQHALLAQRVTVAMENVTSSLASVQAEMRGFSSKLGELTGLQQSHDSNKESIAKIERSVDDLRTTLDSWFDEFGDKQDQRWLRHEAENEDTKRDLEKEIRGVRETVIRFAAFGAAVSVLGGTIVIGFLWNINYRFNDIASDTADDTNRIEAASVRNRQLIDSFTAELADIKLYLARGGRIPEEPYIPKSQRKDHGQEQSATEK